MPNIATLDTMLRSLSLGQHGSYGDPDTIAEAQKRFKDHVEEKTTLLADLKSAVYTMALANGDESTFDQMMKVCVKEETFVDS